MSRNEPRGDRRAAQAAPTTSPVGQPKPLVAGFVTAKIRPAHQDRLAIVYIRQSTPQQVFGNPESTARQYGLVDYAQALGWPDERILVIDEDQGQSGRSAEFRSGFQRLLTEVTLDHVGIVLGLEMSRLARSSKDWHHLLELCAIFGTLLADQDGVYDAADANDRMVLGLKGTMSELELHTLRNRLEKGRLHKAQRGELFAAVPIGYVKTPSGEVIFDPDEQVRAVVLLIFAKFEELGSGMAVFRYLLQHDIRVGIRVHEGAKRGQLEWRRPCSGTVYGILRHPIYAGTYVHGRSHIDAKLQRAGGPGKGRVTVPMEQWKVQLPDRLPAYITWEQYLTNRERMRQNRSGWDTPGPARSGSALLAGLVHCGRCGTRLHVQYHANYARYGCTRYRRQGVTPQCHGLNTTVLDTWVVQQVLATLEPASLELSLQAGSDVQQERARLAQHWEHQLERARYESQKAERHYRAVDPENRLVARTLEQQWEQALREQRQLEEEFDRFQRQTPAQVTETEREKIRQLAADIPALWAATETTAADRKDILRCLIERVDVVVTENTESVSVTIHWAGGCCTEQQLVRPVQGYQQLQDYERLTQRLRELRAARHKAAEIAAQLNHEGFRPPKGQAPFRASTVLRLVMKLGLCGPRKQQVQLERGEWWLEDLAKKLGMHPMSMHRWIERGWVRARRSPRDFWILWADRLELQRLRRLRAHVLEFAPKPAPADLTTPRMPPSPDLWDHD